MQQLDFNALGLKTPTKIAKMNTGSTSTNYYIQNADGEFLIKCIKQSRTLQKNRLLNNSQRTNQCDNCPRFLFEKTMEGNYVLVFKWIEGSSCYLEKLPQKEFIGLIQSYLSFLTALNKNKATTDILPAIQPSELYQKIEKIAAIHYMIQNKLKSIQQNLSYKPKFCIIHGDLHYKNILFKNKKFQSFLDLAELRYGCPTEDLIRLLITNAEQHNFIRKSYTIKLLKIMLENTPFSEQDWIYGLDIFILNKYERLKKWNLRRYLMLLRCNLLYNKIRSEIHTYFANSANF